MRNGGGSREHDEHEHASEHFSEGLLQPILRSLRLTPALHVHPFDSCETSNGARMDPGRPIHRQATPRMSTMRLSAESRFADDVDGVDVMMLRPGRRITHPRRGVRRRAMKQHDRRRRRITAHDNERVPLTRRHDPLVACTRPPFENAAILTSMTASCTAVRLMFRVGKCGRSRRRRAAPRRAAREK
jgi:hypothetical protein